MAQTLLSVVHASKHLSKSLILDIPETSVTLNGVVDLLQIVQPLKAYVVQIKYLVTF